MRAHPYEALSPHLLRNRTSSSNTYALLSETGAALLIDYGYDMSLAVGYAPGGDRGARRPWLSSIDALRDQYGVDRIETVVPTHYHDDHVAGFNLLREVEKTAVWASANVAPILVDPHRYDLPCLWFDPIAVDRSIALGRPIRWHEYELTLHELPGHTLYAAAIAFEVDGKQVVATGDQQDGGQLDARPDRLSYTYRNRFRIDDFTRSAELYRRLAPDLMISGHWEPRIVTPSYLDHLLDTGRELARLHRDLLPLDRVDFRGGRIRRTDRTVSLARWRRRHRRSPSHRPEPIREDVGSCRSGYRPTRVGRHSFGGHGVHPGARGADRHVYRDPAHWRSCAPCAMCRDVTVDRVRFGQQAEALVDVV